MTSLADVSEEQRRVTEAEAALLRAVRQARQDGHSWSQIGEATGKSKQTAFNRYAKHCGPCPT